MTSTKKRQDSQVTAASQSAGTPTEVVSEETVSAFTERRKEIEARRWLPTGAFMTDDHRYYFNGQGPVPSVTTVLELLDKPALSTWKAQQAVRAVLSDLDTLKIQLAADGVDAVVKWALAEVRKTRDSAASIGSGVHHLADMVARASESDSKAFQVSDEEKPYVDAFRAFSARYSASAFVSSEKAVWSLNGYAGTYDLLLMLPCFKCSDCYAGNESNCTEKQLWLIDIKTGKSVDYPEYRLQLAGYRWADWIILPGNPVSYDMPDIQRTGILHLRPDTYSEGYRLYEVPTTYESDYLTFLGLLEAWKWKQRKVKPQPIST